MIGTINFVGCDIMHKHRVRLFIFLMCFVFVVLFCNSVCSENNQINALWPRSDPSLEQLQVIEELPSQPHVTRKGAVNLAVDNFFPRSLETGRRTVSPVSFQNRTLSLSFFPDKIFNIIVSSDSRPQEDVIALSGRLEGQELSTFSMTIDQDNYLIRLQNLDTGQIFRVLGNTETGIGRVTEIDPSKMPPIIYLPPLIPGEEDD